MVDFLLLLSLINVVVDVVVVVDGDNVVAVCDDDCISLNSKNMSFNLLVRL